MCFRYYLDNGKMMVLQNFFGFAILNLIRSGFFVVRLDLSLFFFIEVI